MIRRLAFASIAGTALEYYDFAVYNTLAALIFNKLFFPTFDPIAGTLLSFATFWVGYLSRPVGGILFGHLGDRHGRRFVLVVTLIMMGTTTLLIGLLPTYCAGRRTRAPCCWWRCDSCRAWRSVANGQARCCCRSNMASRGQRGRNASFAQMGPSVGTLLAFGAVALTQCAADGATADGLGLARAAASPASCWWRSGCGCAPASPKRRSSCELERKSALARAPLREVVRDHWRALLVTAGARLGPDVMYSMYAVFSLSYMTTMLGLSRTLAISALAIGAVFNAFCMLVAGSASDRYGRRAVYVAGVCATLLWLPTFFPMLDSKSALIIVVAITAGSALHAFMYGPQAAFIAEQFPTQVRYAGSSLAYTFAGIFAGGIAPLAFTALYRAYGNWYPIVLYAGFALAVTGVVLWKWGNRASKDGDRPAG